MPTRLRVDLAGYHHIINRGVNRSVVFNHPDDKLLMTNYTPVSESPLL